jgi:hypothetical protein
MRTSMKSAVHRRGESHYPNKNISRSRLVSEIIFLVVGPRRQSRSVEKVKLESLILAQNERWRRALHMQVERGVPQGIVERRTGE